MGETVTRRMPEVHVSYPPPYGQEPVQPGREPEEQPAPQQGGQPPAPQPGSLQPAPPNGQPWQPIPQQPTPQQPAPQYGYGTGGGYGYGAYGSQGPNPSNPWGTDPRDGDRRRRRKRRILIAVSGALAFVVLAAVGIVHFGLGGVAGLGGGDQTKALEARYTQPIDWQDCGDQYYCGSIDAPLDWSNAASKTLHIALMEHRPKATAKGAIVVNPGGPGGSGVDFVGGSVLNAVDKTIAASYDVIGFDPPGVGYSSAVKCYDAAKTDDYLYGILPGTVGSAKWIAADTKAQKAFGAACQKNTGDLLAHVDTASAARDMDLIRADLGESTLDYIGYSYGTDLGTIYAGLFPKRVGHFVFDGADDPWFGNSSNIADDGTVQQAVGFEGDLKAWMTACLAGQKKATGSGSCPFTGTVDQGMDQVKALLDQVQKTPLKNSDGRELGSATLATAISSALYDTTEWTALASAFRGVQSGDPKAAFTLADEYNGRTSKGKYYDNTAEAFQAITCLDDGGDPSATDLRKEYDALKSKAPVLGVYEAYGAVTCNEWPVKPVAFPAPVTAKGSGPILIVGNTGDPATPYAGAKALAKQLADGHLLTYVGEGHTIYGKGVSCIDTRVDSYLEHGTVPAAGTRCK